MADPGLQDDMIARVGAAGGHTALDKGEIPAFPLAFALLVDGVVERTERCDPFTNAGHPVLRWRLIWKIREVSPGASQLLCMMLRATPRDPASRIGGIEGCRGF
ncbi:hypothetical protein, partial [Sphingobium olei]